MHEGTANEKVLPVHNLTEYFRSSVENAIDKQQVSVDPHATHYVVNLLTMFARSDQFYDAANESRGIRPLALMLADAADANSAAERNFSLQRIGDVALFVSGFFADSLVAKPVDIDYYIHMGGNAYGSLAEEIRGTTRGDAFADVYRELAVKFQVMVDVLHEVRDGERPESDTDLLRTYEVWRKTGSRRAKALLRQQGVVPLEASKKRRSH